MFGKIFGNGARSMIGFEAFRSDGRPGELAIRGRVLKDPWKHEITPEAGRWENLRAAFHQFESDEVAGAECRISYLGQTVIARSDHEGYVEARLTFEDPLDPGWHHPEVEIVAATGGEPSPDPRKAGCVVPHPDSEFAVISDIDDTILISEVTKRIRMLTWTLFHNFHTRREHVGAAELYRYLHGPEGRNPVFYVSNSPWNLYQGIESFLSHRGFPDGGIYLRDFGIRGREKRRNHKRDTIVRLLERHRGLNFLLIGDAGEHDAELYATIIERFPDRILSAYIRCLDWGRADEEIRPSVERARTAGVEMLPFRHSDEIRSHLADRIGVDQTL